MMTDEQLVESLKSIKYDAILEYKGICENLLMEKFKKSNHDIFFRKMIREEILDKAQEIYERMHK